MWKKPSRAQSSTIVSVDTVKAWKYRRREYQVSTPLHGPPNRIRGQLRDDRNFYLTNHVAIHNGGTTEKINQTTKHLKAKDINIPKLRQQETMLKEKLTALKELDDTILDLVEDDTDIDAEIKQADTWREKVQLALCEIEDVLKSPIGPRALEPPPTTVTVADPTATPPMTTPPSTTASMITVSMTLTNPITTSTTTDPITTSSMTTTSTDPTMVPQRSDYPRSLYEGLMATPYSGLRSGTPSSPQYTT